MNAQQYGFLLVSLLLSLGLFFSLQGDFYTGRHNWQPDYPDVWLSFVVILMLCGLIAGIACGELFRETRLFHAFDETSKAESKETLHLDSLVDKIYGIKSQNKVSDESKRRRSARLVIISCYLVVTSLTGYHAFQRDNVFIAILTQLYFFGACLGGVGVFWLGRFILTIYAAARNRRGANHTLALLRPEYELVAIVYQGGRQRFFNEHPEHNNDESKLPPISPLAAFMVSYPCREGIEIPKNLLQPKNPGEKEGDDGENTASQGPTPPSKDAPTEANDVEAKKNESPYNPETGPTAMANPEKPGPEVGVDPLDQPEAILSAIDSNSEANSEKL